MCIRDSPWLDVFGRPVLAALLMAGTLFVLRSLPALVVAPLAGLVYVAALIGLGTFRQPDVGLVLQLVPDRIKQRIPLLNHRP